MTKAAIFMVAIAFNGLGAGSVRAESAFDHYLKSRRGGVLPLTLNELMDAIPATDKEVIRISFSRSLAKDDVDSKRTRKVFRAETDQGPVFFGFSPRTRQLEILSQDLDDPSKMVFQQVEGFGTRKARVHDSNRALCVSCHQNGGPIFSSDPWSDVHKGVDEAVLVKGAVMDPVDLDPLTQTDQVGARFDASVRRVNLHLQKAKVCRQMCGEDLGCRRTLLLSALARESVSSASMNELQSTLERNWPEDDYGYPSSTIAEAKKNAKGEVTGFLVLSEKDPPGMLTFDDDVRGKGLNLMLSMGAKGMKRVELSLAEAKWIDPKTPRPLTRRLNRKDAAVWARGNAFGCLGFKEADLKALKRFSPRKIVEAIQSPAMEARLRDWPASREQMMLTLLQALGADTHQVDECYGKVRESTQPLKQSQVTLADESRKHAVAVFRAAYPSAPLFRKYCASCHASGAKVLDFGDIEKLKLSGKQFHPKHALKAGVMPPAGAPQPTLEERTQMLQDLD